MAFGNKDNRLLLTLPKNMSEMDVKGTLDGLAKALGIEGSVGIQHYSPKGYDVIMSADYEPLLLLPSDHILGSEASFIKDGGSSDTIQAKITIRCSATAWKNLVEGARR